MAQISEDICARDSWGEAAFMQVGKTKNSTRKVQVAEILLPTLTRDLGPSKEQTDCKSGRFKAILGRQAAWTPQDTGWTSPNSPE